MNHRKTMRDNYFSIRGSLQGALFDFVGNSGFSSTDVHAVVRDFACLLGMYREEDVLMFPQVFVADNPATLNVLSPGSKRFRLGEIPLDEDAAAKVLKDAACLATRGWAIYLATDAAKVSGEYGVFRALKHSYATPAEESMHDPNLPLLLLRNRGHLVVQLYNSKSQSFTVSLTPSLPSKDGFPAHIKSFVQAASISLESPQFVDYLERLLTDLLLRSHGTLLAAITPTTTAPENFNDGLWLNSPLDIYGVHKAALEAGDAEALAELQAHEVLLEGMITSDGVTVFDTRGRVLGYRIFLKPSDDEKMRISYEGGGRRRTFDLMRARLGNEIKAAFFRSQDGATDCVKA